MKGSEGEKTDDDEGKDEEGLEFEAKYVDLDGSDTFGFPSFVILGYVAQLFGEGYRRLHWPCFRSPTFFSLMLRVATRAVVIDRGTMVFDMEDACALRDAFENVANHQVTLEMALVNAAKSALARGQAAVPQRSTL